MSSKDNKKHPIRPSTQQFHTAPTVNREQKPSTEAQAEPTKTHPKYAGFHPKPPIRNSDPPNSQLVNTISEQLQSNIQEAASQFSAQIVSTANELVNNASSTVQSDLQQAAGAIGDAIQTTSANIEIDIENRAAEIGNDIENKVAEYLTVANVEKAAIQIVHSLAHAAIGASHSIMSSDHGQNAIYERDGEEEPLLPQGPRHKAKNYVDVQHWLYPDSAKHAIHTTREKVRLWLCSKTGHYFVLGLVGLDVAGIIAAFIIDLFKCEKRWGDKGWNEALTALDITSLLFSCLFMLELLASIWAFGFGYFNSKFHVVDSLVVVAGFALDLSLHGSVEEAASLIVVLRLWRVFKIIEELSVGAQEQVDEMHVQIVGLKNENLNLKLEGEGLKVELAAVSFELKEVKERASVEQGKGGDIEGQKD